MKLSIKPKGTPKNGQGLMSGGYSVKIGDWELGRGVKRVVIDMTGGKKPEITITANPDIVDIDAMVNLGIQVLKPECDGGQAVKVEL